MFYSKLQQYSVIVTQARTALQFRSQLLAQHFPFFTFKVSRFNGRQDNVDRSYKCFFGTRTHFKSSLDIYSRYAIAKFIKTEIAYILSRYYPVPRHDTVPESI